MATTGFGQRAWTVVVATGILAAMHVWKLPSALEFIRADLGISLVASGALVGVVQIAGAWAGWPHRWSPNESVHGTPWWSACCVPVWHRLPVISPPMPPG